MWCGYPVEPDCGGYNASSNIVHAANLKDDHRSVHDFATDPVHTTPNQPATLNHLSLLLVVGSNDSNVDPACTYQLAAALQREGKAFELHVMVGHGHGCAESSYGQRKRLRGGRT